MNTKSTPQISTFIAISIDGYIARNDGNLDWLEKFNPKPGDNEDYGYSDFLASIDVLIMGRNTYHTATTASEWPYQGKRVIVLSSSLTFACQQAELFKGDIYQLLDKLTLEGVKHIYVDGGVTIRQFLNANLIDQLILTIVPVILGSGISLFGTFTQEFWYQLKSSKTYPNGLAQLCYKKLPAGT